MDHIWYQQYGGKPTTIEHSGTVVDMFEEAVAKWDERPAFNGLYVNLRYNEVDRLSRDFAAWLQQQGVKKGDRVAVMLPNLLSFPVVAFGIIRSGAVMVSVNPLYTPRELAHQINDSGAEIVVIFNGSTAVLAEALVDVTVREIVTLGLFDLCDLQGPNPPIAPAVASRSVTLPEVLLTGAELPFERPVLTPEDLLFLQYTGGTTGLSKGAMLTHSNLMANIAQFEWTVEGHLRPGEETIITALPLYHIFALMVNLLCYFKHGALNVLIANPRDMAGFVKEWSKFRVTSMTGVNTLFVGLMHTPGFEKCDFSEFRIAFGGGAAVQVAVSERWKAMTGVSICEGYGLSETSPVISSNILGRENFGTVGVPMPSTEFSLRDGDGNEAAIGEICVRGPQVMSGYWGSENSPCEAFTEDGFFRTGDIGQFDEAGFLRVVDRKKDMISVSGFNVFPNEIEDVLARMDGLLESAVIGIPDERSGEAVKAFCVRSDKTIEAAQVIAHCRKYLTGYKVPHHVTFVETLPKSTVGKVLRRDLRDI